MKVRIDEHVCQGHALCSFSAPDVFRLRDADGHAEVRDLVVPAGLEDAVRRAAVGCPEQAIVLDEE